jgi:hypothetical protein
LIAVWVLASANLSRHLCKSLESSPGLSSKREFDSRTNHLCPTTLITSCVTREAIQLKQGLLSIMDANARALLHQMCGQAIDTALRKLLAARLARMLVAIARIV